MRSKKHTILFDGSCNFCSFWVKYIIKRDAKDVFRFATLQSDKGKELLTKYEINLTIDSIILLKKEKVYLKSAAALHILKTLGGINSIFYGVAIVPSSISDFFYDIVAKYRYQWFGKNDCEFIPNQNIKNKFLV